jgi:SAM-dependent methyltransferase
MTARPRYEDVTETTGGSLTREAADMLYTRYALARDLAAGKRVLELGCGAGLGFGLLRQRASSLVGGDYSRRLLQDARRHYGGQVPTVRLSADALPFADGVFDLVIFFEASYYVRAMERAFIEIARVLAPGGTVLFANANPERPDFIRSPYSVHYHTADEFRAALERLGFRVTVAGAFPVIPRAPGLVPRLTVAFATRARQVLERLGLVPKTLRGRARLKRLVYGRLRRTPAEIPDGFATLHVPEPVVPGPVRTYKVIYVRGDK